MSLRPPPAVSLASVYFFSFAGLGSLFPVLPLILERRGLTPTEVGWVFALMPVSMVLLPPIWGSIADAWQIRAWLLRILLVASAASVLLLAPSWQLMGTMAAVGTLVFFRSAVNPLTDAAVRALLVARGDRYGRIRMWGSMGFAIAVTTVGVASLASTPVVLVSISACLYLLAAIAAFGLPTTKAEHNPGVLRDAILSAHRLRWVFLGTLFYYAAHSTYDVYFALHLADLGHSERLVGIAWGTGVSAEILLMWFAPNIVRRFSPDSRLAACGVIAALRWVGLATVQDAYALLALQPLHALTFGLWYVSLVDMIQDRAPEHLRSTLQASGNVFTGLGMLTGHLVGGPIFESFGGSTLFRVSATSAACAALLYVVARRTRRTKEPLKYASG